MGWGEKFPLLGHLNAVTMDQQRRAATLAFFTGEYGADGGGYKLGSLCSRWDAGPPWPVAAEEKGWNRPDADDWFEHCKSLYSIDNPGSDRGTPEQKGWC